MTTIPCFPTHVLPEPSRRLVEEGVAAHGLPAELIAVPHLAFTAGIIGRNRRLHLKSGREEIPSLFFGTVAEPSSGKSPGLRIAMRPLEMLQNELTEEYESALAQFESHLANGLSQQEHEGREKPPEPKPEQLFTTNSTMEALTDLMKHSTGLTLTQDELAGWIKSMDTYRSAGDRQQWLSLWSAAPIMNNRRSSPSPTYIEKPAISIVGGIQPEMLPVLAAEGEIRDGMIERLLLTKTEPVLFRWSEDEIQDQTFLDIVDLYRRIRVPREDPAQLIVYVRDHPRARWADWYNHTMERAYYANGLEAGFLGKLPNQVARIVIVLHCLKDPDAQVDEISMATLDGAIELGEYFYDHAMLILPAFGATPRRTIEHQVLDAMRLSNDWMSKTDFHRALGNRVDASDLTAVLDRLVEDGTAVMRTVPSKGRPATEWRLRRPEDDEPTAAIVQPDPIRDEDAAAA